MRNAGFRLDRVADGVAKVQNFPREFEVLRIPAADEHFAERSEVDDLLLQRGIINQIVQRVQLQNLPQSRVLARVNQPRLQDFAVFRIYLCFFSVFSPFLSDFF